MLTIRRARERGFTDAGWLKSLHAFSFGGYFDPLHMGFSVLRVINEDRVIPGAGFGTHPHDNMEIISYVLEGELAHKDSMGNGSVIKPGEVQIMSAGTGVTHSEFNASEQDELHFLQIWIKPAVRNEKPNYQQRDFTAELSKQWCVVASPKAEGNALHIKQDARMLIGRFEAGQDVHFVCDASRQYWMQVVRGLLTMNGNELEAGDGIALVEEARLDMVFQQDSEVIVFDLPS